VRHSPQPAGSVRGKQQRDGPHHWQTSSSRASSTSSRSMYGIPSRLA
jgi:hypothetical protein